MNRVNLKFFQNEPYSLIVSAGDWVFRRGEPAESAFAVLSGRVDIVVNGQVVESIGPGGLFGEMALIDQERRSASAIARTDCELAEVSEARFLKLVQRYPHFALAVMNVLSARLRKMNDLIIAA